MKTLGRALVAGLLSAGCAAPRDYPLGVPTDAAQGCQDRCHVMGLKLSAVVLMANHIGCVCQASDSVAKGSHEAATEGMATIFFQEEEEQRRSAQQQDQQRRYRERHYGR